MEGRQSFVLESSCPEHLGNPQKTGETLADVLSLQKQVHLWKENVIFCIVRMLVGFLKHSGLWGVTVSDFLPGSGMTCRSYCWLQL
jgi:hypothetical protein